MVEYNANEGAININTSTIQMYPRKINYIKQYYFTSKSY